MFVCALSESEAASIDDVGGKAASLIELQQASFPVPPGFVVTTDAYRQFLDSADIDDAMAGLDVDPTDDAAVTEAGERIQERLMETPIPDEIEAEIFEAYDEMDDEPFVAVRSSATAEDLPDASFAGQQDTILNVDRSDLLDAVRQCWASLFNPRAIAYRAENGFSLDDVAIGVVVQQMIDAEKSGVLFTCEPSTGADRTVVEAAWGLGEAVVSGSVTPDTYVYDSEEGVLDVHVAEKTFRLERDHQTGETVERDIPPERREQRVLSDDELGRLTTLGNRIEAHYGAPQDVEWALADEQIYLLQARPITTLSEEDEGTTSERDVGETLTEGLGGSPGMGSGNATIIGDGSKTDHVGEGDVLVTDMTSPDMMPAIRRAAGIVTDEGGMTCHAAIVARELGVPAVLGTGEATSVIADGQTITVDGDHGVVTTGASETAEDTGGESSPSTTAESIVTGTEIKVNVSLPSVAERAEATGADGVGLMRMEHLVLSLEMTPRRMIETQGGEAYANGIADGLREVAEVFYPKPVRIRTLDAPTDEFRELEGGDDEPHEHNPMLGYRGCRRSLDDREAFQYELQAFKQLYDAGYDNLEIMFPLVSDGDDVAALREELRRADIDPDSRDWGVMIETPASALTIEDIVDEGVDFVSFGTNDLTQYVLAVDRNNGLVADRYEETHPAILGLIEDVTETCHERNVDVGICGEAASRPEMIEYLVDLGASSLSVNIDAVSRTRHHTSRQEQRLILDELRD
jgi:pyruvate,water dikinase